MSRLVTVGKLCRRYSSPPLQKKARRRDAQKQKIRCFQEKNGSHLPCFCSRLAFLVWSFLAPKRRELCRSMSQSRNPTANGETNGSPSGKRRMKHFLLDSLNRVLSELYYQCEHQSNSAHCTEVVTTLLEAGQRFNEVGLQTPSLLILSSLAPAFSQQNNNKKPTASTTNHITFHSGPIQY